MLTDLRVCRCHDPLPSSNHTFLKPSRSLLSVFHNLSVIGCLCFLSSGQRTTPRRQMHLLNIHSHFPISSPSCAHAQVQEETGTRIADSQPMSCFPARGAQSFLYHETAPPACTGWAASLKHSKLPRGQECPYPSTPCLLYPGHHLQTTSSATHTL